MAVFWGSPEARVHMGTSIVVDDTVDYTDSNDAVHVDMAGTLARATGLPPIFGGYADGDQFFSIEFVWGSSFGDTIYGDANANGLFGHGGGDKIEGAAGDDTLRGEGGHDTLHGEGGHDLVYGDEGEDTVRGNTGNDAVFGGLGDDTVYGDLGGDVVWGGKGADVVVGGDGIDTLEGGAGKDMIFGDGLRLTDDGEVAGPGPNEPGDLGAGIPVPNDYGVTTPFFQSGGRAGADVAAYTLSNAGVVVDISGGYLGGQYATRVDVSDGSASGTTPRITLKEAAGGHAAGDVLHGIANVRGSAHGDTLVGGNWRNEFWGNAGDDLLIGGGQNDKLWGGAGSDTLMGGSGGVNNDTLIGGAGPDSLHGGAHNPDDRINSYGGDFVSYENSPVGVTVNMNLTGAQPGPPGGHVTGDTIDVSVEDLIGSSFGDLLIGRDGPNPSFAASRNRIYGGPGDDWDDPRTALNGDGTRSDSARGGLFGGEGNDRLVGGPGNDLLAGEEHGDDLYGGPGNDWLHGGPGDVGDWLYGNDGDDWLDGGGGSDFLAGGDGNDTLVWDPNDRTTLGGRGIDTFDATHTNTSGTRGTGSTLGIENFIDGSGGGNINGNAFDNLLDGRAGNDNLFGQAGSDTLVSGTGDDRMDGGTGIDRYVISKKPADTGSGNRETTSIPFWELGEKIDISEFGLTAAQLEDVLRSQGTGRNRLLDFGAGNGEVAVTLHGGGATELTADDFIL